MKLLKNWLLPILISVVLFVIVRPVLAQTVVVPKNVSVGTVSDSEGFSQIYYEVDGNREVITNTRYTNSNPSANGKYITWVGQINGLWQVFFYNLETKSTMQLTYTGNNVNPRADEKGRVVWEGWDGTTWQTFFFDGETTRQLTTGDTSLNPQFYEDYISYSRKDINGIWRGVLYSIKDGKAVDVTNGEKTRQIKIVNGEIIFGVEGSNQEKFPLKVSDLFLLDMVQVSGSTPSANPIIEELSATPSGVMEIPIATESGETGI